MIMKHIQQSHPSSPGIHGTENSLIKFSVRHRIIEFDAFCESLQKIEHVHARGRLARLSIGLLITGQSGSGKTTLLEYYCARFPKCEHPDRTVIPVLLVETPST